MFLDRPVEQFEEFGVLSESLGSRRICRRSANCERAVWRCGREEGEQVRARLSFELLVNVLLLSAYCLVCARSELHTMCLLFGKVDTARLNVDCASTLR